MEQVPKGAVRCGHLDVAANLLELWYDEYRGNCREKDRGHQESDGFQVCGPCGLGLRSIHICSEAVVGNPGEGKHGILQSVEDRKRPSELRFQGVGVADALRREIKRVFYVRA